jgi:hypothetical protein
MDIKPPPPALNFARVLAYAKADESSVQYYERGCFFVGDQLLGPVPRLAICQPFDDNEVIVLHCDHEWASLGAQGGFKSIDEAKSYTEKSYQGINKFWNDTSITEVEAKAYLENELKDEKCSFCGRWPNQIKKMIASENARICDICIKKLNILIKDDRNA